MRSVISLLKIEDAFQSLLQSVVRSNNHTIGSNPFLKFLFFNFFSIKFKSMKKNLTQLLQIFLWLSYGILLYLLLSKTYTIGDALLKGLILLSTQMGLFYLNSELFIPQLVVHKKTWLYILYVLSAMVILILFFYYTDRLFVPEDIQSAIQNKRPRFRGPQAFQARQLFRARFLFEIFALFIILIISTAYSVSKIGRKRERENAQKQSEQLNSEMKFLKSQINPHFLFNALNNIYALTLTGSDRSSDMILKLSHMLRYILYECNEPTVILENEWDYIQNYIEFQKLKSQDDLNIKLHFDNQMPKSTLIPMLLIPFVENAFKHSKVEDVKNGWIQIHLNNQPEEVIFQIENSVPSMNHQKDNVRGIGLENVKRRLELGYPNSYDLIINDSPSIFSVVLRIKKSKS